MNVKFGKFCINTFIKVSRPCIEIFKLCQQILLKDELFLISNWKSTSLETGFFFYTENSLRIRLKPQHVEGPFFS